MNVVAKVLRSVAIWNFRRLGHASILDIPTHRFNDLRAALVTQGWRQTYEYDGIDAWIDYGKVILKKESITLLLEWDNWSEGSIEGPRAEVAQIAERHGFSVTDAWRWETSGASGA